MRDAQEVAVPDPTAVHGRRWTVDEALHGYTRLLDWLATESAVHALRTSGWARLLDIPPELRCRYLAEHFLPEMRESLSGCDLIYADAPMVDLLVAAADAMPAMALAEHELIAPTGMVMFAKPLPDLTVVTGSTGGDLPPLHATRAITWFCMTQGLVVITWSDRHGAHRRDGIRFTYTGLGEDSLSTYRWQDSALPADWTHVTLLRALTALYRQPITVVDTPPTSRKARRAAAKARDGLDPQLRRVYLRRPHLATHELQAARDARAGRTPRGHYVRGHWKHQWYPSIDEHRHIWIEGYLRGDFTNGTVPGQKILIAHAPRSGGDTA